MLQRLWKLTKENLTTLIAIGTVLFTSVYAILKFVIYIYWSGYFNNLNIDISFLQLNYDGFIYKVIFSVFFVLLLLYMMWEANAICSKMFKSMWDSSAKTCIKIKNIVKIGFVNILLSNIYLQTANVPLVIVMLIAGQKELTLKNICLEMLVLYVAEILMIVIEKLGKKDSIDDIELKFEKKIGLYILKTLMVISLILMGSYYFGSQSAYNINKIKLVEKEQYMISYNTGEKYVLHKVDIKDGTAIVYRNEQKIIGNENCEFVVKNVEKIKIVNEYHNEDAK